MKSQNSFLKILGILHQETFHVRTIKTAISLFLFAGDNTYLFQIQEV